MKLFCVPSHKSICLTPLEHQGVMLTPEMFQHGIWFPAGGGTTEKEDEYRKEFDLRRSQNEAEYKAALGALLSILNDNKRFMAVVSMRWCSLTYRLVTARRVWLTIYRGKRSVLDYSHINGHPLDNFCSNWENPEKRQIVWEERFHKALEVASKR